MKKNIHNSLYLINYHCISCLAEYQNYSVAKENKKVETCANCNPAYKGSVSSKVKMELLSTALNYLINGIKVIAFLLSPIVPESSQIIFEHKDKKIKVLEKPLFAPLLV